MKIVLTQPWGGLGDNVQLTTIPELAYNTFGEKCVYVSNSNVYRYSEQEIKEIVWNSNPYIAGFTDDKGKEPDFKIGENFSHIESLELSFGLSPTNKYPKIYYDNYDKKYEFCKNAIFIDLTMSKNNITAKHPSVWHALYDFILDFNVGRREVFFLKFPHLEGKILNPDVNLNFYLDKKGTDYYVKNLYEYANIIKYCDTFICSNSGPHALASGIKQGDEKPNIFCFCGRSWYNSRLFIFPNVKYIIGENLK